MHVAENEVTLKSSFMASRNLAGSQDHHNVHAELKEKEVCLEEAPANFGSGIEHAPHQFHCLVINMSVPESGHVLSKSFMLIMMPHSEMHWFSIFKTSNTWFIRRLQQWGPWQHVMLWLRYGRHPRAYIRSAKAEDCPLGAHVSRIVRYGEVDWFTDMIRGLAMFTVLLQKSIGRLKSLETCIYSNVTSLSLFILFSP